MIKKPNNHLIDEILHGNVSDVLARDVEEIVGAVVQIKKYINDLEEENEALHALLDNQEEK